MSYTSIAFSADLLAGDEVKVSRGVDGNASVIIGTASRRIHIICPSMADLVQIGMAITDQAARLALPAPYVAAVTDDMTPCAACAELGHDESHHHEATA